MKIEWVTAKYGSSKTAYLGHNFTLVANYPMAGEGFEGFVLGKCIGTFDNQEKCMKECKRKLKEIIEASK